MTPPGGTFRENNRFVIERQLGAGASGVVYRAYDRERESHVALKLLGAVEPGALFRFKREFRLLAGVVHPNLVTLYELISDRGLWFFSMELIEGVDLVEHVRGPVDLDPIRVVRAAPQETSERTSTATVNETSTQATTAPDVTGGTFAESAPEVLPLSPPLSPESLERLRNGFAQLARGVRFMHLAGHLHRDIKPANVLVTKQGRVVLLDFGISSLLAQTTGEAAMGTPAYMAPEQVSSNNLTEACDWYAFGTMMFEALTGSRPFRGNTRELVAHKRASPAPRVREPAPWAPQDLDALCEALLAQNPADRPSGDDVLRRLAPKDISTREPLTVVPPAILGDGLLVGRDTQLATLRAAFEAVKRGTPEVVFVHGVSGMGKSALVRYFLRELERSGQALTLDGRCYEQESVPYKALDGLIDSLCRCLLEEPEEHLEALLPESMPALAQLFPVLRRLSPLARSWIEPSQVPNPEERRMQAAVALRELLRRLAARRPLAIFIDDLQWGDLDSGVLLEEVLRRPGAPSLLTIGSYRREDRETSPFLTAVLPRLPEATSVAVDPLSPEDAGHLAETWLKRAGMEADLRDHTARISCGSPLFIAECIQFARASIRDGGEALASFVHGEVSLDDVISKRFADLPAPAQTLLELVSVAGHPMPRRIFRAASSAGEDENAAVVLLCATSLVRVCAGGEPDSLEPYHDRVRSAVSARIPEERRRQHHLALAKALESSGSADPETMAVHFEAAGDALRAGRYFIAAADASAKALALGRAAALYERALSLAPGTGDDAASLHSKLGSVFMSLGHYEESERWLERARSLAVSREAKAEIGGKLGELGFKKGDIAAATAALEDALRSLGRWVPRRAFEFFPAVLWEALVQTLHTQFPSRFVGVKDPRGSEADMRAVRLMSRLTYAYYFCRSGLQTLWPHLRSMNIAEAYGPTPELGQSYSGHAVTISVFAWHDRSIAYAERGLEIRRGFKDELAVGRALHFYGMALYVASRFKEARERLEESVRVLQIAGDPWEMHNALFFEALSCLHLGEVESAAEMSRRLLRSGNEIGDLHATCAALEVLSRSTGGDLPEGAVAEPLLATEAKQQRLDKLLLIQAEGQRLLGAKRPRDAEVVLAQGITFFKRAGMSMTDQVMGMWLWYAASLRLQVGGDVGAGSAQDLVRRARVAAQKALKRARRFRNWLPHALREEGRLAALSGLTPFAMKCFEESLEVALRQGQLCEVARTRLARAGLSRRLGLGDADKEMARATEAMEKLSLTFNLEEPF